MQTYRRSRFFGILVFCIFSTILIGANRFSFSQEVDFSELATPQIHRNAAPAATPRLASNPETEISPQNLSEQNTAEVPQKFGALLLNTGSMIEGEITREKNEYMIRRPVGRLKMPVYNVEYVGADRYDIYQYKRQKPITASYDGTFNLAKWCLSNGMYDEAIAEFEHCKKFAPFPQAVKALDNEIAAAERVRRAIAKKQEQQNSEESANSSDSQQNASLKTLTDDLDEFDYKAWSMTLEPKVLDKFKKEVEPQLLKRCGSATCHGSNSTQEFRVYRSVGRISQSEATARNLKAALEQIDFLQPQASPLIQRPQQAHGGSKPIFHRQTRNAWNAIFQWIQLIPNTMPKLADQYIAAQNQAKQNQAKQIQTEQPSPQHVPIMQQTSYLQEREQEVKGTSSPIRQVPTDFSFFTNNRTAGAQIPKQQKNSSSVDVSSETLEEPIVPQKAPSSLPKKQGQLRSSDPFDPNLFNQRFHR